MLNFLHRNEHLEGTTLIHFAFHRDRSAMRLDEFPRDRQSDSTPLIHHTLWKVVLEEALENPVLFLRWDSYPCIHYKYLNPTARIIRHGVGINQYFYPTILLRKLERVRKQVEQ